MNKTLSYFSLLLLLPYALSAQTLTLPSAPEEDRTVNFRPVQTVDYNNAKVSQIPDLETGPKDFWVLGTVGDYRLENDLALFQFGGPNKSTDPTHEIRTGGLLDITISNSTPENFHVMSANTTSEVVFGLKMQSVEPKTNNEDGSASIIVKGTDLKYPFLEVETEYRMPKDMPGVLATTTYTNTSTDETAENIVPSDYIRWGAMVPFIPGEGVLMAGRDYPGLEFVFAKQYDVWMLIAPEFGTFTLSHSGVENSGLEYSAKTSIAPGETQFTRRWILVSQKDPGYLFSKVLEKRENQDKGTLVGRLIEREQLPDGSIIESGPVPNAEIRITPRIRPDYTEEQKQIFFGKPYLIMNTDERGIFNAILPVGEYQILPAPTARISPASNFLARITKGEITALDYGASKPSRLIYQILDENGERVPAKLTIEPLRSTAPVDFGPPGELRAGNSIISNRGAGFVELNPGNYRVIASRGPEYHITEQRITIQPRQELQQIFNLRRAYETPGWISADVGVRTEATSYSRVNPRTRLASAAAEGVEWLVTGDNNTATDLSSYVTELGLESRLKTSPGYRVSGDTLPFRGEFLLFPTDICSTGTNPDFTSIQQAKTSNQILSAMRALCPEAVIMLNRPTFPNGYLSLNGYNSETGVIPEGDWSKDFDVINIWDGKRQGQIDVDYATYHRLIQSGMQLAAFGSSNSTGTLYQETGYPRVYIPSNTDDPAKLDPAYLAEQIKKRNVIVTNGPFIEITANGQPMGSLVTDTDGRIDVDISVKAPNWVRIDSINVNLNGQFARRILITDTDLEDGVVFPLKGSDEGSVVTIRVPEDAILDVTVQGDVNRKMDPVNPFRPLLRYVDINDGQYPMAISAPIFIDADGDGQITINPIRIQPKLIENQGEVSDPPF
ncbi:MAG: CehA/McbA family metallohydrolase [Sumerlaeia bacterium]